MDKSNEKSNPWVYIFATKVSITIDGDSIVCHHKNGEQCVEVKSHGGFFYEEYNESRVSPMGLFICISAISVLLQIALEILFEGRAIYTWSLLVVLIGVNVGFFVILSFDNCLHDKLFGVIVRKWFGKHYYFVCIENRRGADITFLAHLKEKDRIQQLEKHLLSMISHL